MPLVYITWLKIPVLSSPQPTEQRFRTFPPHSCYDVYFDTSNGRITLSFLLGANKILLALGMEMQRADCERVFL